jgi:plastocyanin
MQDSQPATRRDRRAIEREHLHDEGASNRQLRKAALAREARNATIRKAAFGVVTVAVLGIGGLLAFGDFLNRPVAASGSIDVQSSMAGFTPSVIRVKAGSSVTLDWWTQDAAVHLQGGVHTMVSPDLGLSERLPAESRRQVAWTVPDKPGTYDVWCDTCCGGKDSPTMHGKIVIEAA